MNALEKLGIEKKEKPEKEFARTLFYFIREFHINPLDEEYLVGDKKVIKKGIPIPLFNSLMVEMQEHYKRENEEMKKSSRKR